MKKARSISFYVSIVVVISIILVTSVIDTHRFDMSFNVDSAQAEINVDKVKLSGLLIKFPIDLYFIKGQLTIDDIDYEIANYKKSGSNPIAKVSLYELKLIDGKNEDYTDGIVRLNGDIIKGDIIDINITLSFMDKLTGYSYSQTFNASPFKNNF